MSETRIGVFVCHCGKNIGGIVDVPGVTEYAKTLPDVVYSEHNLYTCSEEGTSSIRQKIKEYDLNRVIVASCTPRTHEPLFRSTCETAGLNKYLFEFVNIRDQCSWVHMRQSEKATEKAKDLIRMGVAKARLLQPLEEIEIKVNPCALVIGGGVVGMNAALNLAGQGLDVHIVERERELGGLLSGVYKLFPTNEEAAGLLTPFIQRVKNHGEIKTHLGAKIKEVSGFIGNFDVTIDQDGEESKFNVGTIIVATGANELKPAGQYGYGEMPNVLTQLDLEGRLKEGLNGEQNFVMINCVGARIPERPYCSRFCCMTAIKNATLLKEQNPKARVWILHRDLMTYGTDFENYYRKAMEQGVRFIRYSLENPPQIIGEGKAEKVKVYHELFGREIELPCDMLILTTPLIPTEGTEEISKMLKVPLSEHGFFLEAHLKLRPVEFATDGIFICGSARWPTDIAEGISQAYAAAAKAAIPMRAGFVKPEAITASVDEDVCAGCGVCETLCAFEAIELKPKDGKRLAEVTIAQCKGCGTCGAACPSGAITMNHFTDEEILAQIEALAAV
jgi:heterodisulfide reductase subunit A